MSRQESGTEHESTSPQLTRSPLRHQSIDGTPTSIFSKKKAFQEYISESSTEFSEDDSQLSSDELADGPHLHAVKKPVEFFVHKKEIKPDKIPKKYNDPRKEIQPESAVYSTPRKLQPESASIAKPSPSFVLYICLSIVVALVACAIFTFCCSEDSNKLKSTRNSSSLSPTQKQISALMKEMSRSFPGQPTNTWMTFIAAVESILEDEPPKPAVLLLVGSSSSESTDTVKCVARHLAVTVNKFFEKSPTEMVIRIEDVIAGKRRDDAIKKELDDRMRSILAQSASIVVGHLEQIPPKAAMILHGFCDNFSAPFKKNLIILTATFDSATGPLDSRKVERLLRQMWDGELGADESSPLVSRVANLPVVIHPDSTSNCGQ